MTPERRIKPDSNPVKDFFVGLKKPVRLRHESFDVYTQQPTEPQPAVIFVHGGPVPEGQTPTPRNSDVFTGYGALAASQGLVGVTFDHRLHTMEHYPLSAEDLVSVVARVRELDEIDADRVALWFFSGGGGLAADWLRESPPWLRGIVWTYPVLAAPPDWPGDGPRFDCISAVADAPHLPKLLVRVGDEFPAFADTQDAVVEAADTSHSVLEVIDIPEAAHGYETMGYAQGARKATEQAVSWIAEQLHRGS